VDRCGALDQAGSSPHALATRKRPDHLSTARRLEN
jgi:hypothetical protein